MLILTDLLYFVINGTTKGKYLDILKDAFEKSAQNDLGIKEVLQEVKLINISQEDVFDATRRAYSNTLGDLSNEEIISYFALYDETEITRHVYNIKGFLLEQEVEQQLIEHGFKAALHDNTNHPDTDIVVETSSVAEYQIKATDDTGYINETLNNSPEIEIITTANISNTANDNAIYNTGLEDSALEELVTDAISPIPVSVSGFLVRAVLVCFGFLSC